MSLFENRKRSRIVLSGAVLGTSFVSAVNQGVVGAVPQSGVDSTLKNFIGKGVGISGGKAESFLKNNWYWLLTALGLIVAAGLIVYYKMYSNRDGRSDEKFKKEVRDTGSADDKVDNNDNIKNKIDNEDVNDINNEEKKEALTSSAKSKSGNDDNINNINNNINNKKGDDKENEKEKEGDNKNNIKDYSVDGKFREVFQNDDKELELDEENFKKWYSLNGCVFNISKNELLTVCENRKEIEQFFKENLECQSFDFVIKKVGRDGSLRLGLLNKDGETCLKEIQTKNSVNDENKVMELFEYLDSKKGVYFKEMPFGKIFRFQDVYDDTMLIEDGQLVKFEGRIFNTSLKELRMISCRKSYVQDVVNKLVEKKNQNGKIRICIKGSGKGSLILDVLNEQNEYLGEVETKCAIAADVERLENDLSKNSISGTTPFSEVFCVCRQPQKKEDVWKGLEKFNSRTLYIDTSELMLVCSNRKMLGEFLNEEKVCFMDDKSSGATKVKIQITFVDAGFFVFGILDSNDRSLRVFGTMYAVGDVGKINRLVEYLEQQTQNDNKKVDDIKQQHAEE